MAVFAQALAAAGFDAAGVRTLLRADREQLARAREIPVQQRRLGEKRTALTTLVELFVLGGTIDAAAVDAALAPLTANDLERLGLVSVTDAGVRGEVRLVPHDELLITSDRPDEEKGETHVAAVHRPSVALAHLTVRRTVERALDVGTGNGVQAILMARHADHIVATDVNTRALSFAQFNCLLNGVENVELREGNLLEPVEGELFDLVVTNPPYVISPESEFLFRDSGLGGDRISAEVLRAVPAHLADGGVATVMASWIDNGGEPTERPNGWLEGCGCDAWILYSESEDPLATAAKWNADAPTNDELAVRLDRWLDYYRANGIEGVRYGSIVLRRRDGVNWIRAAELGKGATAASAHIERLFLAADALDLHEALDLRLRFVADSTIEEQLFPAAEGWTTKRSTLKLEPGLGFTAPLDALSARIVGAIDPRHTVRECLDAVAADTGLAVDDLHVAGGTLVRRLFELGFLEQA